MGHFQQELVAGVLATVIGGVILAMLTGSGGASKFFRFVLVMGALVAIGAFFLAQQRGGSRWRRGDVPAITQLAAAPAQDRAQTVCDLPIACHEQRMAFAPTV